MSYLDKPDNSSLVEDLHPTLTFKTLFKTKKDSMRYHGSHLLKYKHPSKVPDVSRNYCNGDPVHLIDWKAFARTEKLLIREDFEEASGKVVIHVDASYSMRWPDQFLRSKIGIDISSKLELAVRVALNIAYTFYKMGDQVKVYVWWLDKKKDVPVGMLDLANATDVLAIFHRLEKDKFTFKALEDEFIASPKEIGWNDYSYWISDGLTGVNLEESFRSSRHTRFIHLLSSLETDVDWVDSDACYYDEYNNKVEYLGTTLTDEDFLKCIEKWQSELKQFLQKSNGSFQSVSDKTPVRLFHSELVL